MPPDALLERSKSAIWSDGALSEFTAPTVAWYNVNHANFHHSNVEWRIMDDVPSLVATTAIAPRDEVLYAYGEGHRDDHSQFPAPAMAVLPRSTEDKLTRDQCPPEGSQERTDMQPRQATYMAVVGALLWLASFTRPDLAHAASVLARFVSNPAHVHFVAMQRVLTYLHHTRDMGLRYSPDVTADLQTYSDADWSTKFSTAGCVAFLYGCAVHWHTRLQRSVSHSTAEAEYVAASMASRETCFLRELLLEFGRLKPGPTTLFMDSKSAIDMAFDPVAFKKTKHILRDAEYLRDLVARQVIVPRHVPSAEQVADAFTKALPRLVFHALRDRLVCDVAH